VKVKFWFKSRNWSVVVPSGLLKPAKKPSGSFGTSGCSAGAGRAAAVVAVARADKIGRKERMMFEVAEVA
jgi:hypothetical protein